MNLLVSAHLLSFCASQTYEYSYKYTGFSSSTVPQDVIPKTSLNDGDQYGAAVSVWKGKAIVSSTRLVAMDDGFVGEGGIVYMFYRKGSSHEWIDSGMQFMSPYGVDGYGHSIAIWDTTIAVGAPLLGNVHVYSGTNYQTSSELEGRGGGAEDYFGYSVAVVHGSGHYSSSGAIVVGAYGHSENKEHQHTGSAFVFALDSFNQWKEVANLQPARVQQGGYFGYSVAAYGNTIAVGAPGSESAYVFSLVGHYRECPHEGHMPEDCEAQHHHRRERRRGLQEGEEGDHEREEREREEREHNHFYYTEWQYKEELEVSAAQGEELGFGTTVAVYNDTTLTVAIGAIYDYQVSSSTPTGSVYVISQIPESDAISSWHPTDYFPEHEHHRSLQAAPDEHHNDQRYWPIKLTGYTADKLNKYWTLETTVYGSASGEKFGHAIAIEYNHLVIGNHPEAQGVGRVEIHSRGKANSQPVNSPIYQGPLYMTLWAKSTDISDVYGGVNDMFGGAVSLYDSTLFVGSYLTGFSSSSNMIGTGAVYAYDAVTVTATLVEDATASAPVVDDSLNALMKSMTVLSFSFIVAVFSSVCGFVAYKVTLRKINDGSFDSFYALVGWTRIETKTSLSDIDSSVTSQHAMLGGDRSTDRSYGGGIDFSTSSTSSSYSASGRSSYGRPGGGQERFGTGAPGQHQRQPPPRPGQSPGATRQISLQQLGGAGRGMGSGPGPGPGPGPGRGRGPGARPSSASPHAQSPSQSPSRGPASSRQYSSSRAASNHMSGL